MASNIRKKLRKGLTVQLKVTESPMVSDHMRCVSSLFLCHNVAPLFTHAYHHTHTRARTHTHTRAHTHTHTHTPCIIDIPINRLTLCLFQSFISVIVFQRLCSNKKNLDSNYSDTIIWL